MSVTKLLKGLTPEDAIVCTMIAAQEPIFPWFIVREMEANGFDWPVSNYKALVWNWLRPAEEAGIVRRVQRGWMLTAKGSKRFAPKAKE